MKKPSIKPNDVHVVVNDFENPEKFVGEAKCFDASGKLLWKLPCLAKGQQSDYTKPLADTPPGLYKIGAITQTQDWEPNAIKFSFGKWFLDLEGLEQNEERYGRAGCGIHGGRGDNPNNPLEDYQVLKATHGCIRFHNADIDKIIVPLVKKTKAKGGTVYVSVYQN